VASNEEKTFDTGGISANRPPIATTQADVAQSHDFSGGRLFS
jgi:hypothetical protein